MKTVWIDNVPSHVPGVQDNLGQAATPKPVFDVMDAEKPSPETESFLHVFPVCAILIVLHREVAMARGGPSKKTHSS